MNRRRFLRASALALGGSVLGSSLVAVRPGGRPVRVRGVVRGATRGIAGVAVSDGLSVVRTGEDGTYTLLTSSDRAFIQVSVPAGYRLPVNPTGTARFYRALAPGPSGEAEAVFDLERSAVGDERHAFLVLADIQAGERREMRRHHESTVPDVKNTVRSLGVEAFGVACGDIVFDRVDLYPQYEESVLAMGIPFVQVVGNHDTDRGAVVDEETTRTFCRYFGPRHYSFERGAVHYVVLDDVFWYGTSYIGYLDPDQLQWLRADLAGVEPGRTVVVFLHIPLLGSRHRREGQSEPSDARSVTNRDALAEILAPYRAHVLAGHMHECEHRFEGGLHEHVCGAVCGAWWTGPICADGTPMGYAVYEVSGSDVRWRYKAIGRPPEAWASLERSAADPLELVANVWDWDPAWRLVLFEDGERRGALRQAPGPDPTSVRLYAGRDLPRGRTWVDPYPIDHLFRARLAPGTRRVTVEATDRFGRVRIATLA